MLKPIKDYIDSIEDIPFEEFYNRYVMNVQSQNIELEIRRISANLDAVQDITNLNALTNQLYERTVEYDKSS